MPLFDQHGKPIIEGMTVRMIELIPNHEIVQGVDYEVVQVDPNMTLRHPATGEMFRNRAAYVFYITGQATGPW